MSNYLKVYRVLGCNYGIEDFKSPGEHFFNGKDSHGKRLPRFMLWAGGCGIGHVATLEEANHKLYQYVLENTAQELHQTKAKVRLLQQVMDKLTVFGDHLEYFKVKQKGKTK